MAAPLNIEPNGVYDDGALVLSLGLTHATLARARRDGHLRFSRKGKRVLYLGQWIIEWLRDERTETRESSPDIRSGRPRKQEGAGHG